MSLLGEFALWIAFLIGIWGAAAGFTGGRTGRADLQRSSRNAVFALAITLLIAMFAVEWLLFARDFNVEYVAAETSRNLPTFYTWSALYAGQKGSLLFWATVLSIFGSLAMLLTAPRHRIYLPYVAGVVCVVAVFFITVMLGAANPFARLPFTPPDGNGMNPQLQNPGMVFHPPMLYLGYISITIPFAFAVAALLSKRLDVDWLVAIRKWTILSWLFLSIGICLGMWWAYVELGWGGYWAWDPVENASFLPWLVMTAFLHSVMIQEKRGMLKKWNLGLILAAWVLSIFGTFITRSGVIQSVHSFTQSPVGSYFSVFLFVSIVLLTILYVTRLPLLQTEAYLESLVSREASFLFNNLMLVGIAVTVLTLTIFPILSELFTGNKIQMKPPAFNVVNVPLGLALLALTGIGPLIAWRRASIPNLKRQFAVPVAAGVAGALIVLVLGMRQVAPIVTIGLACFVMGTVVQEFARGVRARHRQYGEMYPLAFFRLIARNRRRYGGYVVHTGMVMLFVAFTGMAFKIETEASLKPGESVSLRSPYGWTYTFKHLGVSQYDALNRQVTAGTVVVSRDGKTIGTMVPEKRQHVDSFGRPTFQPSTAVAIRSDLREDLYVVLGGVVGGTETAVYRFTINPLVWWVWYGGIVVAFGGVIVMWPGGTVGSNRVASGYTAKLAAANAVGAGE
ncbi:MAG TPA: cytochrome c-type biogenesis CcmF C-terminal domain-containing protein [Gemmatimonadales bacterium]|nr:cytochrome c-type biogenesis CcmF C-terminal domain-containing protein [Gemmatimonadales bacterium]